ncbi:VOC family protein [Nesterenkonia sp. HG001]|uniref:VOC family protein n=1 Tax=Nesterenkonia sp. HG001 TaxID=2983207 RepID=UPI002AC64C76|nr:VOC family protein [Nesterenkonia sp. HG001]MDZ5079061.1 VOC family protein [Nesterenkonia sp. HG001]
MPRVIGIGGFFFRARDPERLSAWYAEHLDVLRPPASYEAPVWTQAAGPTVFAPFGDDGPNEHLGPSGWGLNLRVDDLDGMVARLLDAGLDVTIDSQIYPNGRFASLHDPEGNPIQLWEVAEHPAR